jgi:hypothetical protein
VVDRAKHGGFLPMLRPQTIHACASLEMTKARPVHTPGGRAYYTRQKARRTPAGREGKLSSLGGLSGVPVAGFRCNPGRGPLRDAGDH